MFFSESNGTVTVNAKNSIIQYGSGQSYYGHTNFAIVNSYDS